jgi:hypothetical protein
MKALLRLVIAALVIHATWRAGTVFWRNYQFRDGVQQTAQFSGHRSNDELVGQVMELARANEIPLEESAVNVRRTENHTLIDVSYEERIELLPRYFYPWRFNVNVDAFTLIPKQAAP